MFIKNTIRYFFCLFLVSMILSACSSQSSSVQNSSQPNSKPMPAGKGVTWHLVVIGDSSLWGLGKAMAKQIEADQGVKVEVYDAANGGLSAGSVRYALETGNSESYSLKGLMDALRDAEYVIMFVNPLDSMLPDKPLDLENCFSTNKATACGLDRFANYVNDLEFIWKKTIELRVGQPTILRATDIYNPILVYWQKYGTTKECTTCWENMSAAARQAAANLGIPFLSRYDDFNGSLHRDNPRQKGFIRDDGEHPTDLANEHTAQLLAAMGYNATIP